MIGRDSGEASRADPGTREAMAEQETQALLFQVAKVVQGVPWPWLWARPPRQRVYSPPPQIFLGKFPSGRRSGGAGTVGRSGGAGTRGRSEGAGTRGRSGGAGTRGRSGGAGS